MSVRVLPRSLVVSVSFAAGGILTTVDAAAQASSAQRFDFSILNMMRGPELYGREPQRPRFTPDNKWIYFNWLPPGTDWRESTKPYRVRAQAGSTPERVTDAHMDSVGPVVENGALSADRLRKAVSYNGDLYLVDLKSSAVRRLTDTQVDERDPQFSADGKRLYFIRDGMNVMALELDSPLIRQLTDIRAGPAPAEPSRAEKQRAAL